ncbi:MAG: tRNA (N6-isopentenyl adenosine(37)-C2)-methylthiotransferase MiaB [Actinobacteria bacterium]|nr:tRNA (N6-isopentenyl adenosine(37)-C2)-methylthiotransferase MiaB [Actinomycetota bacterium]
MNKFDSERIAGLMSATGYRLTNEVNSSNLVIFNTCCVRKHAEQRLYGRIGELKRLKKNNPNLKIAVGGCLAQSEGRKIQEKFPYVDIVFGTHNLNDLPQLVEKALVENTKSSLCETSSSVLDSKDLECVIRKDKHHAWVPITIGCNNSCSYCIVPYVRGKERSYPKEDIFEFVRNLSLDGAVEITLLGQNVNSYGNDIYGKPEFSSLLKEISGIDGIKRVRFTTSHPKDLTDEIIDNVSRYPNICEHIHLPVQAGSDRVLKLMNRKYTKDYYLGLVEKIRKNIQDVSITTDIIVGFPGETEDDFKETLEVVEKSRFDQAFTFIYSSRKGTKAETMKDEVKYEVKAERFNRLLCLQNQISLEENKKYLGRTLEVLVEGSSKKDSNILSGRTRNNKVVNFEGSFDLAHKLVDVKIEEAFTWFLKGSVV